MASDDEPSTSRLAVKLDFFSLLRTKKLVVLLPKEALSWSRLPCQSLSVFSVNHVSKTQPALFQLLGGLPEAQALVFRSPITMMVP